MIFSPNGSEIPKLFVEVFANTFKVSFEDYLVNEGRGFIALVVSSTHPNGTLAARCGLDEQSPIALEADARNLGWSDVFGGYFNPSLFQNPPISYDVLLVKQRWLDLDLKGRTAIAYHEACHCFRESKLFQPMPECSDPYRGGKHYRKFTGYHDNDDLRHDGQWFALLVDKAGTMQSEFSGHFASPHEVINSGLSGDLLLDEGQLLPEWKAEVDAP